MRVEKTDLEALELGQTEILDRNVQHDVSALLAPRLNTQPELVVDHWHQVLRHLHVELHHVGPVLDGVPHGGQGVLLDGAATEEREGVQLQLVVN